MPEMTIKVKVSEAVEALARIRSIASGGEHGRGTISTEKLTAIERIAVETLGIIQIEVAG